MPQAGDPELRGPLNSKAIEKRIGNTAEIGMLWKEAKSVLQPNQQFILDKILYSGSHSGDQIALSDLDFLAVEIAYIRAKPHSNEMQHFLELWAELIEVAKRESNPIVFV